MAKCGVFLGGIIVFLIFGAFWITNLFITRAAVDRAKRQGELEAMDASNGIDSSVSNLEQRFTAYIKSARTLGNAYQNEGIQCYNSGANNAATTNFMQTALALLNALGSDIAYNYISYAIPGPQGHWGDCGCRALGGPTECYYTDTQSRLYVFRGADFNSPVGLPTNNMNTESYYYTQFIMNLTAADRNGVWHKPEFYSDPEAGITTPMLTFTIPLTFGTDGRCTAAAGLDVKLSTLKALLRSYNGASPNAESIFVDLRENQFIASSLLDFIPYGRIFNAMTTPSLRINNFTKDAYSKLGNTFNKTDHFSHEGMLYQAKTFLQNWVIIERSPLLLGTRAAAAGLDALLQSYITASSALGTAYSSEGIHCHLAAEQQRSTTQFLQTTMAQQTAYGSSAVYMYVSYEIPGTGGQWGDCGCSLSGQNNLECYYVSRNGTLISFSNGNFDAVVSRVPDEYTTSADYTMVIRGIRQSNPGVWHPVSIYNDPALQQTYELLAYSQCLSFDLGGNCILAASIDVSLKFMKSYLTSWRSSKRTDMVFLDGRNQGTFVASTDQTFNVTAAVYPARGTPDTTLNGFLQIAFEQLGYNFLNTSSFSYQKYLYNTERILNDYIVVEHVKTDSGFHLRSARNVDEFKKAAEGFFDMYSHPQQIGFFFVTALFVVVFFVERICVVCCCGIGAGGGDRKMSIDNYVPMEHK